MYLADIVLSTIVILLPVIIGGTLHMFVVANDYFPQLKKPLSEKLFGANKTYRGLLVMPVATLFGCLTLIAVPYQGFFTHEATPSLLLLGFAGGLGYILLELPNSYVKRRLGIAPGKVPAQSRNMIVAMDQLDSLTGIGVFYFFIGIQPILCVSIILLGPFIFLAVKRLLFLVNLKRQAT